MPFCSGPYLPLRSPPPRWVRVRIIPGKTPARRPWMLSSRRLIPWGWRTLGIPDLRIVDVAAQMVLPAISVINATRKNGLVR